jgi:cytochrome c5
MRARHYVAGLLVLVVCAVISVVAQERSKLVSEPAAASPAGASPTSAETHASSVPGTGKDTEAREREMRLEGEKRFRTNCGRCHQAPHKFPPRVMATAIRHMRVRAMITDEDMRLILRFMTQ